MDFEALERLWRSHDNDLSQTAQAYLLEDMMKTLKQRRNQFHFFMGFLGLLLMAWTAATGWLFYTQVADVGREWSILVLLGICWAVFLGIQSQYHKHMRRFPNANATLPEALAALLDENRTARHRAQLMLAGLLIFVAAMAFVLWQLHDVGKMEPRHVMQFALLAGGALGLSVLFNAIRYVRVLIPEGAHLKALLDDYRG